MKMALIEWDDAYEDSGWSHGEDESGLHVAAVVTCGFIKKETKEFVSVILTKGKGVYTGSMTIPRGCIKRIRYLKVKESQLNVTEVHD